MSDRTVKPWYIIAPNSSFKETWDTLIFFLILYTAIIEPMRISYWNFEEGNKLELFFIIIAILIDVVFAVDIFINFFAAYVRPDGSLDY